LNLKARLHLAVTKAALNIVTTLGYGPYMGTLGETIPGGWQRNLGPSDTQSVLAFSAVYACISLIAGDISKLRPRLMASQPNGTWQDIENSAYSPVLRKPNHFQTMGQFVSNWIVSKLIHGNTYVLKEYNQGGKVRSLYILDPCNVQVLVATNGDVYYRLRRDDLADVPGGNVTAPASEIIHDRMLCFWHPLIGVSPLFACGLSALQGIRIQTNSSKFFANMSRPGGVLSAPGKISQETAIRIKEYWDTNFSGDSSGKTAVLGDGLAYQAMTIPPIQAQMIEQLGWTVGDVARCFHVPPYKLGLDTNLTFTNAGQLDQDYYSQCLQALIESFEVLMDEGLGLNPRELRIEFDLEGLLRMDPLGQSEANAKSIGSGELAPNEARLKRNLPPVLGGDTPYLQQQNWALSALAKRDASFDPSAAPAPPAAQAPAPAPAPAGKSVEEQASEFLAALQRRCMTDA